MKFRSKTARYLGEDLQVSFRGDAVSEEEGEWIDNIEVTSVTFLGREGRFETFSEAIQADLLALADDLTFE